MGPQPSANGASPAEAPAPAAGGQQVAANPAAAGPAAAGGQWVTSPLPSSPPPAWTQSGEQLPGTPVPIDVQVEEARTGRFMFGAGINSDAGVTGQVIVDERNFDLFGFPRSWDDVLSGQAFRGGGQGFRIEAIPGNRVQRYLVSFTEPYLFWTPISLNVSGFYYDRGYYDWDENRVGGRLGLGYRLTPDLSVSATARGERVKVSDIRVPGVTALEEVEGNNELFSGKFGVRHDTRDLPFMPTEGHLIEMSYEQAFGDFDYPRGEVDYRKYFLVRERPDGSGRHTLSVSLGAGFSGAQTPIFENYFAGGFTTLRGFEFRGASPIERTVRVGGRFRMLGSVQYMLPVTADDMIRAVTFVDFGTVERDIELREENFRVAPGFGFRISIPAMGPAPLAFDFAFPVAEAQGDETQVFSFFFGFGRG
jgi:outer membrane protein insertion porin family